MEIKFKNLVAPIISLLAVLAGAFLAVGPAEAHHILGRPSYALNEDSNTPPAMQVETRIGAFAVNYMIYPAFPRPGEAGRINLYVKNVVTGNPYIGKVNFTVRDNSWRAWIGLGTNEEKLGAQILDDNVYRQGFIFKEPGSYIVRAAFLDGTEPHVIDFPLDVGQVSSNVRVIKIVGLIALALIALTLMQRRRVMTGRIKARQDRKGKM